MTDPLQGGERRTLALLGLPTLALALATTTLTTYLPVIAEQYLGSRFLTGVLIGIEGLLALWLPVLAGRWSDRTGRRLPFLMYASPSLVVALAFLGLAGTALVAVPLVIVFYASYFVAYEPYRALYPDLVRDAAAGRAQSTQAVFRGVGTFLALAGGGWLLGIAQWLPFTVAAALAGAGIAAFSIGVRRSDVDGRSTPSRERKTARRVWTDNPDVHAFLGANTFWELSLAALKTFIFIYVTRSLGLSPGMASLVIGAGALFVLVGSAASGSIADRIGKIRVMTVAVAVFGLGMVVPWLVTEGWAVAVATPFICIAGGVLLSLPYALLQPLMHEEERGALSGLYSTSRGIGIALGPILAGLAIDVGGEPRWMWLVASAGVLASLPFLRRVPPERGDAARGASD